MKKNTINLTQHQATKEQKEDGVFDLQGEEKQTLVEALTFNTLPSYEVVCAAAKLIAQIAAEHSCDKAMIGGAPFLMRPLEDALMSKNITPLYAFSKRESVEETQEDGSVIKKSVFKHMGFVGE